MCGKGVDRVSIWCRQGADSMWIGSGQYYLSIYVQMMIAEEDDDNDLLVRIWCGQDVDRVQIGCGQYAVRVRIVLSIYMYVQMMIAEEDDDNDGVITKEEFVR